MVFTAKKSKWKEEQIWKIQEGTNGFPASSDEDWVNRISLLIENESLRKKIWDAGRQTVKEKYSIEANKDKWLKVFNSV